MAQTDDCVAYAENRDNVMFLFVIPNKYDKMLEKDKIDLIRKEVGKEPIRIVNIISAHYVELWRIYFNTITMVDSWNMDEIANKLQTESDDVTTIRNLKHPWFFNLSGSLAYYDNDANMLHFNVYLRSGFYLLKSRWDLAVNYIYGYNKDVGLHQHVEGNHVVQDSPNDSSSSSFGIDTRVYFPFKKIRFNPFVGLGVSRSSTSDNSAWTVPVSVGFSIPTRKGCFDVNYQYNKVVEGIFVVGYTFMLK